MSSLVFICDNQRHLVCYPYTIENLHATARALDIKPCWFHRSSKHEHYDLPKRRIEEITAKCLLVAPRELLSVIKNTVSEELMQKILKERNLNK